MKGWWRINHSRPDGCGKTAFYCRDKPVKGLPAYAGAYRLLDGSLPAEGEFETCGSCQKPINPRKIDFGECTQIQ